MSSPLPEVELLAYLDELIAANSAGKISWAQANPTTYVWEVPQRARVTLQQTMIQRQVAVPVPQPQRAVPNRPVVSGGVRIVQTKAYVLQVMEMPTNAIRMNYQATADSPAGGKLGQLFDSIASTINKKNIDFLKSLVPP